LGALCRLALGCLAKRRNIRNVLRPSRRELRGHKISAGNKKHGKAALRVDDAFNPPFPCGVKLNAGDAGKNIDSTRFPSEADEITRLGKVFHTHVIEGSAEAGQRRIRCVRVRRVSLDEQVYIFGGAGCAWKDTDTA
jgi:hypothetical protein